MGRGVLLNWGGRGSILFYPHAFTGGSRLQPRASAGFRLLLQGTNSSPLPWGLCISVCGWLGCSHQTGARRGFTLHCSSWAIMGGGPAGLQHSRVTLLHHPSPSVLLAFLQPRNIPEDSTLSEHQPPLLNTAPSRRGTRVIARDTAQDQALRVKPTRCSLSSPVLPRYTGTVTPTGLAQSLPTVAEQKARLTCLRTPTRPPNRSQHHQADPGGSMQKLDVGGHRDLSTTYSPRRKGPRPPALHEAFLPLSHPRPGSSHSIGLLPSPCNYAHTTGGWTLET